MQQLTDSLNAVRKGFEPHGFEDETPVGPHEVERKQLIDAATDWSGFCLRNLTGDLLRNGLNISTALADFVAGLEASNRDFRDRVGLCEESPERKKDKR